MKTNVHVKMMLDAMQNLEEMGGPDTLAEYVKVLETVRSEIDTRVAVAKQRIEDGEE